MRAATGTLYLPLLLTLAGCISSGGDPYSANAGQARRSHAVRRSGKQLYDDHCGCMSRRGNGKGRPVTQVGFDLPLPDFTDCSFNSPEQSADWVAVAHEGGPIRGFSPIMPAFGDALTTAELEKLVAYVRGFCADKRWPRGELNFPPLFTEKAFPENETLLQIVRDRDGSSETKLVYEKRVGARGQYETRRAVREPGHRLAPNNWERGFGDIVGRLQHVLAHRHESGYILSAAAELSLPPAATNPVFGLATRCWKVSWQWASSCRRVSSYSRAPSTRHRSTAQPAKQKLQVAFGRAMTSGGPYGRQWNPMVEVLGARPLESGASTEWDWVPQVQFSINQRQHLLGNIGVRLPLTDRDSRDARIGVYFLWDWFDGGLRDGW